MREILFRGKTTYDGSWVQGNLFIPDLPDAATEICVGTPTVRITYPIDPKTIGQYTGLKDKNGKKIFEGDIMRNAGNVVEFCSDSFCINGDSSLSFWTKTEIIGNIYDNPELL